MLKKNKNFLLAWLAVLILVLLIENLFVPSFQQCIYGDPSEGGTNYTDYSSRLIGSFIGGQIPCTGAFFDGHAGFLAAISGFIVAFFTYTLWSATTEQGKLTQKSIDLARDEFNATHRPEIIIHTVRDVPSIAEAPNRDIGAHVSFFNKGMTDARSVVVGARIMPINGEPEPGITIPALTDRQWGNVAAGKPENFWVASSIKAGEIAFRQATNALWGEGTQQVLRIYCIGVIGYADANGVERQTGFCWEWKGYSWERVKGSSYDYAY